MRLRINETAKPQFPRLLPASFMSFALSDFTAIYCQSGILLRRKSKIKGICHAAADNVPGVIIHVLRFQSLIFKKLNPDHGNS